MGYFDGMTDSSFKEDEQGNILFYPFGPLGSGRVIPNEDEKQALRRFLKRSYKILILLCVFFGLPRNLTLFVCATFIFLIPYYWLLFRRIRNFEVTKHKLTYKESLKNSAHSHSKKMLWFVFSSSLLFVLASIFLFSVNSKLWLISVPGIVFFGFGSLAAGYMIKVKGES